MLTVVVAALFPAKGVFADVMDWVVIAAIALLFFLYGARLHPREALGGLTHWRLHLLILAFTFVVFPIIGVAMRPLVEPRRRTPLLGPALHLPGALDGPVVDRVHLDRAETWPRRSSRHRYRAPSASSHRCSRSG